MGPTNAGFRLDVDNWLKEHEEARLLEQEILQLIQVRPAMCAPSKPWTH